MKVPTPLPTFDDVEVQLLKPEISNATKSIQQMAAQGLQNISMVFSTCCNASDALEAVVSIASETWLQGKLRGPEIFSSDFGAKLPSPLHIGAAL